MKKSITSGSKTILTFATSFLNTLNPTLLYIPAFIHLITSFFSIFFFFFLVSLCWIYLQNFFLWAYIRCISAYEVGFFFL